VMGLLLVIELLGELRYITLNSNELILKQLLISLKHRHTLSKVEQLSLTQHQFLLYRLHLDIMIALSIRIITKNYFILDY
jgi:hypothetical protein